MNLSDLIPASYLPEIIAQTGNHLLLVGIAIAIATLVGIPLGIVATRTRRWRGFILGFANIVQTIPSLAIFGFLISVPFLGGIGNTPAIVALTLYSLLPIIRNTFTGITTIDPAIKEAGMAMGMTDWQLLRQVEIPLALKSIVNGIRVAAVIAIGIATIAPAIGADGLGVFIYRGIAMVNNQLILAGAIPAAFMAIFVDLGLGWIEKRLSK